LLLVAVAFFVVLARVVVLFVADVRVVVFLAFAAPAVVFLVAVVVFLRVVRGVVVPFC